MRTITIDKVDGKYKVDVNVKGEGGSFDPPDWIKNAAYGMVDEAVPPAGTKVRCYTYYNDGTPQYYKDIVADGSQTLDSYFGWDLEYIGNIGDVFMVHKYQGNH